MKPLLGLHSFQHPDPCTCDLIHNGNYFRVLPGRMAGEEGGLGSRSIEEIFSLLDSTNPDIVSEIQRLFYENLSESRDPWLVGTCTCICTCTRE